MRNRILTVFAALAVALSLMASPVFAQDTEGRVTDLEGRENSLRFQVNALNSLTADQQATIAGLQVTVSELVALVEGLSGAGEPDPAIALNALAVSINGTAIQTNASRGIVNTGDLDDLFARMVELEILAEEGGGNGSPGLIISAIPIRSTTDISVFPLATPIWAVDCYPSAGGWLRNCLMIRDPENPNWFRGYGIHGNGSIILVDIRTPG